MNTKFYSKKQLLNFCKEWGLTNVELYYRKGEGWNIESDQFNDWISMDSAGFVLFGAKRIPESVNKFNKKYEKR